MTVKGSPAMLHDFAPQVADLNTRRFGCALRDLSSPTGDPFLFAFPFRLKARGKEIGYPTFYDLLPVFPRWLGRFGMAFAPFPGFDSKMNFVPG
jgi:hypothetical protein